MRRTTALLSACALAAVMAVPAGAAEQSDRAGLRADTPTAERLDAPATAAATRLDDTLLGATGDQGVIVRLSADSLAERGSLSDGQAQRVVRELERTQDRLISQIRRLDRDAVVVGQVQRVLNAVFVRVDAAVLEDVAALPGVERVAPVGDYELSLDETVPYIGASAVQDAGVDGTGIDVAVLDSGVDYTHAGLGGEGTLDAYEAAHGVGCVPNVAETILECDEENFTERDGLFPTAKVTNGYDFVGEDWIPGRIEQPDPDPIDYEGHGTHVADIIAGVNGVAPGANIWAVKVCSSVSPSCSGVGLIMGMEFSVDPNFDGRVTDRVDIINMSLGSNYGQPFDDDLSAAVDGATALGVLTVSSAGNGGDKPFIQGSPSGAPTALSVAQTQVPSAVLPFITVTAPDGSTADLAAVFQPWSPEPTEVIATELVYASDYGDRLGCAPFDGVDFEGRAVLVDRGACNFTLKAANVSAANGGVTIIGLVAPGAPFSGGDGGDRPITTPTYMVSQADSNLLKATIAAGETTVTIDPASGLPLAGSMVGSSARGPQYLDQRIKPEIGAPGASISAIAGTGTGTGPFGGTSGASPMVAGSAALVLDATGGSKATGNGRPNGRANGFQLSPLDVKALLMNTAETEILEETIGASGTLENLAPISRIGGGEVRVNNALGASAVAYDEEGFSGGLSFGFVEVPDTVTLTRTVTVKNLTGERQTFDVVPQFRAPGPEGTGAVTVDAPETVSLRPGQGNTTSFDVSITIDGSLLPSNGMNSGPGGADASLLTAQEFDGYLVLDDGDDSSIHMPWHVLPRKVAEVTPAEASLADAPITLTNGGSEVASLSQFALMALDEDEPEGGEGEQAPTPDIRGVGVQTFPGGCLTADGFIWQIAVNNWEPQTHAIVPGAVFIDMDTDGDGTPDHLVYNYDLSGLGSISDGRNVTWSAPYVDFEAGLIGPSSAFWFTQHNTLTNNTVLTICSEQVGLDSSDFLTTNVTMSVEYADIYFGGPGDVVEPFTISPLGEQYIAVDGGAFPGNLAPGGSVDLDVLDFGVVPGDDPALGVMLFTGDNGGATQATEAVYLLAD